MTTLGAFSPLATGVWRAVAEPEAVTVGLVAGPGGALVIDTGSTPGQGAAIRRAAEDVAGVPVVAVAVTHAHDDHIGGLAAFGDVPSYGQACVPGVSVPFALARTVDLGGCRVELVHFGPAHTAGDIVAIVPGADVVFAGDLIETSGPPSFGPDSSLDGWPQALDGILGVLREQTIVVPGHGEPVGRVEAFEQRAHIAALMPTARWLASRGVAQDDALTATQWPFPPDVIAPLLPRLWAATGAKVTG